MYNIKTFLDIICNVQIFSPCSKRQMVGLVRLLDKVSLIFFFWEEGPDERDIQDFLVINMTHFYLTGFTYACGMLPKVFVAIH